MRNQIEKEHRSSTTNTGTNRLNKSPTAKNAERERSRVRSLRNAFHVLQTCLPTVPPDTKLSKLDILILATNYIAQLTNTLDNDDSVEHSTMAQSINISPIKSGQKLKYYHPIKKWPMRSRLYSHFEWNHERTTIDFNNNNNDNNFQVENIQPIEHDYTMFSH